MSHFPTLQPNDPNSDQDDPKTAANERPWYDTLDNGRLRGAYHFAWPKPRANTPVDDGLMPLSDNLSVADRPWKQIVAMTNGAGSVKLQLDFSVILAAHTIEDVNGSAGVYIDRASADWVFNGDGDKINAVWQPTLATGNYLNDGQKSRSGNLTPTNAGTVVLTPPLGRGTRVLNQVLGASERDGKTTRSVLEDRRNWVPNPPNP